MMFFLFMGLTSIVYRLRCSLCQSFNGWVIFLALAQTGFFSAGHSPASVAPGRAVYRKPNADTKCNVFKPSGATFALNERRNRSTGPTRRQLRAKLFQYLTGNRFVDAVDCTIRKAFFS